MAAKQGEVERDLSNTYHTYNKSSNAIRRKYMEESRLIEAGVSATDLKQITMLAKPLQIVPPKTLFKKSFIESAID